MTTLREIARRLRQYEEQEARSIVRLLLSDCFSMTYTDICCGALDRLSPEDGKRLEILLKRLEAGEPVQYVTGKAMFKDREFHVESGVLIPRPETETLIDCVVNHSAKSQQTSPKILDVGTGSGCIAVTLTLDIKGSAVTAWDISNNALTIAQSNAMRHKANIQFEQHDALHISDNRVFDIIVSNPPYICNKEAVDMEANVLDHEPFIALFVPDNDPLLFYRSITEFAKDHLSAGGLLAFEINPLYAKEMVTLLENNGFKDIQVTTDEYGKERVAQGTIQDIVHNA